MLEKWKTIIEPFRIKMIEPLGFTSDEERETLLKKAHYNLFQIPADKVLIDLLTDSGTSAMSSEQWACMMRGDESYAGARSFFIFEKAVKDLTGYQYVLPVHQGRAAERILMSVLCGPGKTVIANTHFDTTRANVEAVGARALDLPVKEALDFAAPDPFKGNIDIPALKKSIAEIGAENIPMIIMTITNNSLGGQPVSLANLKEASEVARKNKIPLMIDAARFAENAFLIKQREPGQGSRPVLDIAREIFSCASGCLMSAKKDAFANIGGFLAFNNLEWLKKSKDLLILGEGFPTYGGLAGRDLEAIAQGLKEILDENYLSYRMRSAQYLAEGLRRSGVPIVEPPGGHAIYVDAKRFLPHIPPSQFPAQSLVCELYLTAGIRSVEVGSLMFGRGVGADFKPASMELVRLALPRRVYTQSHVDFIIEVFGDIARRKESLRGLEITEEPASLRHFTVKLKPIAELGVRLRKRKEVLR